jgi:hypothetical protein
MDHLESYWQAVEPKVCEKCIDGDRAGNCLLGAREECGLKRFFPRVVGAVLRVQSATMGPYIEAVRKDVCACCPHQATDGTCPLRARLDCGLDRYLPLVVEAVEAIP